MRIDKLQLNNFKKFANAQFCFHPQFTVLIGNNASGKTSILDALSILLGTYLLRSGIVLIDEIDLHLHPKWQRVVVDSLKGAFEHLQFIVTTHSPFILQSLAPGEVIDLNHIPSNTTTIMANDIAQPAPGDDFSLLRNMG